MTTTEEDWMDDEAPLNHDQYSNAAFSALGDSESTPCDMPTSRYNLGRAQVLATLALAAAVKEHGGGQA